MGISNVVALKEVVSRHETAPLDQVANAINIKLRLGDQKEHEVHNHRLEAGTMLVSLRERVEAEGLDWWSWAKGRFDRSRKDIEKVMRLASADDPVAAAAKERANAKAGMSRARGANVSSTDGDVSVSGTAPQIEVATSNGETEAKYKAIAQTIIDRFSSDDIWFLLHDVWAECCCGNCLSYIFAEIKAEHNQRNQPLVTDDNSDESEIAPPEVIAENILYFIARVNENARVFNKLLKVSVLDREAVTLINTAIDGMTKKWRSIQSTL
jgi:hypothetical protein